MLNYIVNTEYYSYREQDIIFSKANKLKCLVTEYSICFIMHPVSAIFPDIAQIIPKLSLPSKVGDVWVF